jgi:DNA ligase (NAD+)
MYPEEKQKRFYMRSKELIASGVEETEAALQELRDMVVFHEWKYYIQNDPVLSDYEFDQLYKRLEEAERKHPEWVTPDSPTQRVSADLTDDFPAVPHSTPMLSLDNSYNEDDLMDFDRQVRKLTGLTNGEEIAYTVEPKFDGGSVAIVYEGDRFLRSATRGDGVKGEEITANMRVLRSVPLKAAFSTYGIHTAEVRGEALIRKDRFLEVNDARRDEGLALFANPRNAATGGLRMKVPEETAKRGIEVFLFQLGYAVDKDGGDKLAEIGSHSGSLELLEKLGFRVPGAALKRCTSISEVLGHIREWEEKREDYGYEIDGMVVKVDDFALQEKCGFTSHHPRWAIAFKFKAKQASSKLLKVEYQVGKIGSITPVAKIDPVHLAGVTVSSISLHNEDFITSKDIRLGDTVLVERAGDVIPYIVKPLTDLRDGTEQEIRFPEFCPINDTDEPVRLVRMEGEAAWRCPDCVCGAQDLQRMVFHVSKDAMDIDGLGRAQVEKFYELGWLRDFADIYALDYEKIEALEGYGKRSVDNLRESIERAKRNPLKRLLHSLSIHHLGKKASALLAAEVDHIMDLRDWDFERFTAIKELGPVVARNVLDFFSREKNAAMLTRMESLGVNMRATEEDKPPKRNEAGPLSGKTILFTGTLQKMSRKEAQDLAIEAGAQALSAVSSNLDILVVGEKAGSKLKKAKALGTVEIWTEAEFLERIKQD